MATIKDVAAKAGVSIATVSNVLHGKVTVNSAIVTRVQQAIKELNYYPNMLASNLRVSKVVFIGVVVPALDKIYSNIIDGLLKEFENQNIHLIIKKTSDFRNVENQAIHELVNMGVKGIILVTCNSKDISIFHKIREKGISLVFVARRIWDDSFPSITFDNYSSVKRIVNDLLTDHPDAKLQLFTGPLEFSSEKACYDGFIEACRMHQLEPQTKAVPINKQQAFIDILHYLRNHPNSPNYYVVSDQMLAHILQEVALLLGITECNVYSLDADDWYQLHNINNSKRVYQNALKCGEIAAAYMKTVLNGAPDSICHQSLLTDMYHSETLVKVQSAKIIRVLLVSGLTADSIVALLPDFTSSTGIKVEYDICENHHILYQRIIEARESLNRSFDVVMLDYLWLKDLVSAGYLHDIRALIERDGDALIEHFIETIRRTFIEQDGSIYALPVAVGSQMLLYRKDLFEDLELKREYFAKTGIELNIPATWSEFNTVARFFTRTFNADSPVRYGTCLMGYNPHGLVEEFMPRLWANRGKLYDGKELKIGSEKARRTLESLCETYLYSYPNIEEVMETQQMSIFSRGDVAMINTFSLHIPSIYNIQQEWLVTSLGMSMLPGNKPMLGEWMLGVAKDSSLIDESFLFLKWVTSNRLCIHSTILGGFMPKKKVIDNKELESIYPWKREIEQFLYKCKDVDEIYCRDGQRLHVNDIYTILGSGIASAIYGTQSAREALERMEEELLQLMR